MASPNSLALHNSTQAGTTGAGLPDHSADSNNRGVPRPYTVEEMEQDQADLSYRCPITQDFPTEEPPSRDIPFRLPGSNQVFSLAAIDNVVQTSRNGSHRNDFGIDPRLPTITCILNPITRQPVDLSMTSYPAISHEATTHYYIYGGGAALQAETVAAQVSFLSREEARIAFQIERSRIERAAVNRTHQAARDALPRITQPMDPDDDDSSSIDTAEILAQLPRRNRGSNGPTQPQGPPPAARNVSPIGGGFDPTATSTNEAGTDMHSRRERLPALRSPGFQRLLVQLMRFARDNFGFGNSLAYGRRTGWFNENTNNMFAPGGIFQNFQPVTAQRLQRLFSESQNQAQQLWRSRSHQDEPTGASAEDQRPESTEIFFEYFQWLQDNPNNTQRAQNAREQHRRIEADLIGEQPPLGQDGQPPRSAVRQPGNRHARTEDAAVGGGSQFTTSSATPNRPPNSRVASGGATTTTSGTTSSGSATNVGNPRRRGRPSIANTNANATGGGEQAPPTQRIRRNQVQGLHNNAVLPLSRREESLASVFSQIGNAISSLAAQSARPLLRSRDAVHRDMLAAHERVVHAQEGNDQPGVALNMEILDSLREELRTLNRIDGQLIAASSSSLSSSTENENDY